MITNLYLYATKNPEMNKTGKESAMSRVQSDRQVSVIDHRCQSL